MKRVLLFSFSVLLLVALAQLRSKASSESDTQEALLKTADDVLADVSRLRELEVKTPIARGIKSREEIRAHMIERIAEEYKPDELEIEGRVLKRLGLIPQTTDYYQFILSLLTEQIAGYYDPTTKTFYIADWLPAEEQRPIMAHELTHALQDQHFGVAPFLKRIKGNDDAVMARNSILEGDAAAVMIDYLMQPLGMKFTQLPDIRKFMDMAQTATEGEFKVFASAAPYFRETLVFPYTAGVFFLQSCRLSRSWTEVAKIYTDLPTSTEQIMHPDKYLGARDDPTVVEPQATPGLPGDDWKPVYSNVLGEFTTLLVLKTYLPVSEATEAAAGWDGDSVELFRNAQGKEALLLRSVWDTEQDATQFFDAYRAVIAKKYPQAREVSSSPTLLRWRSGESDISLKRDGVWVEIVE